MEVIRSKTACSSCRERKRKCNGDLPCSYCVRNQHECSYDVQPRRGRRARHPTISAPELWTEGPTQLQLLEANSPAVFVQRLASNSSTALPMAPGLPCYAWNLGFGPELIFLPNVGDLTEILTVADMRHLATVFFSEISPVYDFVDRPAVEEAITRRWAHPTPYDAVDSLLLGIAALGSLFGPTQARGTELERQLVYSARVTLEYSSQLPSPDVDHVVGWLLRVIYLRLTSTPHATWMASCILMHMVETTKLHFNSESDSILALSSSAATCPPERRRKIYHVAQLFNTWVSLDCGKSPVDLRGASSQLPQAGWTVEQRELHRLSMILAPHDDRTLDDLETALRELCTLRPAHSMLQLLQCNIALCIFRRATALTRALSSQSVDSILDVMCTSLREVDELLTQDSPWWHVLNIPFQIVCVLLVVDHERALEVLTDALRIVRMVAMHYQTHAAKEAYELALSLVKCQRHRRSEALLLMDRALEGHQEFMT